MAIKDILLPLVGDPSTVAIAAIDKCMAVVGDIGARVTAMAVEGEERIEGAWLVESVRRCGNSLRVRSEQRLSRLTAADLPANFAVSARLKDLSLVPVKPDDGQSEKIIEGLKFGSGRPILMCPEEFAAELPVALDDVVIAWDHTAPAARSVADALPMLQAADRRYPCGRKRFAGGKNCRCHRPADGGAAPSA